MYMESIIAQIISIDELAQKRLQEASRKREEMRSLTDESIQQTIGELKQEAENRIAIATKQEEETVALRISEIDEQNKNDLKRLEKTCSDNHEKLESKIFENVINAF